MVYRKLLTSKPRDDDARYPERLALRNSEIHGEKTNVFDIRVGGQWGQGRNGTEIQGRWSLTYLAIILSNGNTNWPVAGRRPLRMTAEHPC